MYCTPDDLYAQINKTTLIDLATEPDDAGDEYEDRIISAINASGVEINGYLARQYAVPLLIIPDAVKNLCVDIAVYKIFCRKGIAKDTPEVVWFDRYKNAVKFLEGVRDGKNDIGIVKADGVSSPSGYVYKTPERTFDDDFWRGY